MDLKRNFNCWYKDVCTLLTCDGCIRFLEMKYLLDNSGIPKSRQIPAVLDAGVDYTEFLRLAGIKNNIDDYVKDGFNLYITSHGTGNGKTSWAIKLMLKYFDLIWPGNGFNIRGLFVHVPTLLSQLKNFENPVTEEYRHNLLNADLIIWDDIASTKLSEYDHTQLLSYIDSRVLNRKANIYTGNIVNFNTLQLALGPRLASRVWNMSLVIELKGKDRRNDCTSDSE